MQETSKATIEDIKKVVPLLEKLIVSHDIVYTTELDFAIATLKKSQKQVEHLEELLDICMKHFKVGAL